MTVIAIRHLLYRCTMCLMLLSLYAGKAFASQPVPFLRAARGADTIVHAEISGSEGSVLFLRVVEGLRGKPGGILVSSCIWDAVTGGRKPPEGATFLLLLRGSEELMCGHVNGIATLSGGCVGLLPIVGGSVPKEFASRYDGSSEQPIPLDRIRRDLNEAADNK